MEEAELLMRLLAALVITASCFADAEPLARWRFESLAGRKITEDVSGRSGEVSGNCWTVKGAQGSALAFDGISGHVVWKAANAPTLNGAFSVEAWIAIGAYPFNWAPILQQQRGEQAGYFFGIGDQGQVAFRLAAAGKWQGAETTQRLALREWAHVAAVYDAAKGVTIYINGKAAAAAPVAGAFVPAPDADLWIGRNNTNLEQTHAVGKERQAPTRIFFDGILDEITISAGAVSTAEFHASAPSGPPPIEPRVLPSGPKGPAPFGAVYAKLPYYKGWDDMWRVADTPDVLVRFDDAPYRYVFWRGTSYIPHWVTENGIWYDNEFTESFQKGLLGSAEPMSDKQCRYSHVRIIESNDARVVVHWRYAPIDVNYTQAYVDPSTGWGDWTDEVHTIYPDGIAVRRITLHSSNPKTEHEWHEGIVVMGPGMTPNDALEPAGLTLANNRGESHTYSWEKTVPPKKPSEPANASIQLIHTKSKYKPFVIARTADRPWFDLYASEIRRDVSIYPWWNHWPAAQEPSNGRYALAADRASHSSLTHLRWEDYASGADFSTKIMLHGMTGGGVESLAEIARSWEFAAAPSQGRYDAAERAYVVERERSGPLALTLTGSGESPVHNVAIVAPRWGKDGASLLLNGKPVPRGRDFRFGHRETMDGSDLVAWIRVESKESVRIELAPVPR